MSIERVREYFRGLGMERRILEFDSSSATVALAAKAVGCEPSRIAKTLSFLLPDGPVLIVAAGDVRVGNAKYKAAFGAKARMVPAEDAERLVGHAVGGVCPFAVPDGVRVYLDASLRRFDTVYPACGSANSAIGLTIAELEAVSRAKGWIDVCRPTVPAPEV